MNTMFLFDLDAALAIVAGFALFLFVPANRRWLLLLVLSTGLLYVFDVRSLSVAAAQSTLGYLMGFVLARWRQRWLVITCIVVQLVPLLLARLSDEAAQLPRFGLHLGVSFYTFQILAYLIDIAWARRPAERHLGRFLAQQLLFANKIAGPIERPALLDQLKTIEVPSSSDLYRAALMIWLGLFQKLVLADQLGLYTATALARPREYAGLPVLVAVLLSKYQVYCDFAGASCIALGLGGLFGLRLTPNFDRPFAARSLRDYWRRWHISLQAWIRDYVFQPLLTTPLARLGTLPLLALTFVIFGLWHGFRWTFVVYGLVQALLVWLAPERLFARFTHRAVVPLVIAFNYVVLISLPAVLFRSTTLTQAWDIWASMGVTTTNWSFFADLGAWPLFVLVLLAAGHETWHLAETRLQLSAWLGRRAWLTRMLLAIGLLAMLLVFARADAVTAFFYAHY